MLLLSPHWWFRGERDGDRTKMSHQVRPLNWPLSLERQHRSGNKSSCWTNLELCDYKSVSVHPYASGPTTRKNCNCENTLKNLNHRGHWKCRLRELRNPTLVLNHRTSCKKESLVRGNANFERQYVSRAMHGSRSCLILRRFSTSLNYFMGQERVPPTTFLRIPRGHNFERYMKLEAHLDNIWNNGFNFKSLLECLLEL